MRTLLVLLLAAPVLAGIDPPREWLVIGPVNRRGRRPFNPDLVFRRHLLDPDAAPPREGEEIGGKKWIRVGVNEQGRVAGRYAYAYAALESGRERIVIARVRGGGSLFVNGAGYVGDVYGMGHGGVPVLLRQGANHLFVRGMRGGFRLELEDVAEGTVVSGRDATLPDFVAGERRLVWGSAVVMNASRRLDRGIDGLGLVPLGVRKVPFLFEAGPEARFRGKTFRLDTRQAGQARRVTFVSGIDGSVQYYGVVAPRGEGPQGLVLSLHGAGVEARNQAGCYAAKPDLWIVAPTNRRPFGFDWQDWGRTDAYEVLRHALAWTGAEEDRIYVTGHSMGGHGVWHLGANDPDRWAAIAPCASWPSFDTYGGGRPTDGMAELWRGADLASLTRRLVPNLRQLPTFILHGAADQTVPLAQAQMMEEALRAAGAPLEVHYEEGKGHWYNGPASPGVDCVDWPGIFQLFGRHRRARDPDEIEFMTADPGIDSRHHWIEVLQPQRYGHHSRVRARRADDGIAVATKNVRAFRILHGPAGVEVDGAAVAGNRFVRTERGWTPGDPSAREKSPVHSGPFKRAFDRRFILVYGHGDRESLARARYDAQVWWYRGNGDAPVMSDERFLTLRPARCNVILYGNADTNRAFAAVLRDDCPIRVKNGVLQAGTGRWEGDALGCVFVFPRRGEGRFLVGVFGSTSARGARLGYALLPFVSGVGYPDYALFDERILAEGDGGVLAAGWFDHAWRLW